MQRRTRGCKELHRQDAEPKPWAQKCGTHCPAAGAQGTGGGAGSNMEPVLGRVQLPGLSCKTLGARSCTAAAALHQEPSARRLARRQPPPRLAGWSGQQAPTRAGQDTASAGCSRRRLHERLLEAHDDGGHVVAPDALALPGVGRQAGVQQLRSYVRQRLPASRRCEIRGGAMRSGCCQPPCIDCQGLSCAG